MTHNIKDKKISLRAEASQDFCSLVIQDNAGGINKEDIHKLFDPYYTTKSESGGSGLGLYTAKLIATNHFDGDITVTNKKDGASFNITLKGRSC